MLAKLSAIPAEKFEKGCYENGWNGRQILAHITAIEWTYPKLIDVAREGDKPRQDEAAEREDEPPHKRTRAAAASTTTTTASIERYADASVAELLEVFKKNRETTIAAIEAADDDLFLKHGQERRRHPPARWAQC